MGCLDFESSLHYISNYLLQGNNYRIYHALDDYFVTDEQLKKLKDYTGEKTLIFNHGSHLGFLYRKEFMDNLIDDIKSVQTNKTEIVEGSV